MSERAELRETWRAAMSAATGTPRSGASDRDSLRAALFQDTAVTLVPRPEPAGVGDFLVFFPAERGYGLLDAGGRCPEPGERFELHGVEYDVLKIAVSPFPGDRRPCACLERRDQPIAHAAESADPDASRASVSAP